MGMGINRRDPEDLVTLMSVKKTVSKQLFELLIDCR